MKPTLFADTVAERKGKDGREQFDIISFHREAQLRAVRRILPRRCPEGAGTPWACVDGAIPGELPDQCSLCEMRGWLYPDPPDIPYYAAWKQDEASMALWRRTLEHVWRAMGITDED